MIYRLGPHPSPGKASAELGERLAWERAMKTSTYTMHYEYLKMMETYGHGAAHKDLFVDANGKEVCVEDKFVVCVRISFTGRVYYRNGDVVGGVFGWKRFRDCWLNRHDPKIEKNTLEYVVWVFLVRDFYTEEF